MKLEAAPLVTLKSGRKIDGDFLASVHAAVISLQPETLSFLKSHFEKTALTYEPVRLPLKMREFLRDKGLMNDDLAFYGIAEGIIRSIDPATGKGMKPQDFIRQP